MKQQHDALVTLLLVTACVVLITGCGLFQSSGDAKPEPSTPKQTQPTPPNADKIIQTGIAQLKAGKINKAIASFKKALKVSPNNLKAEKYLLDAQTQKEEIIQKALRKGIVYFENDELEAAMKEWKKVLALDPSHEKALDYKKQTQIRLDALQ